MFTRGSNCGPSAPVVSAEAVAPELELSSAGFGGGFPSSGSLEAANAVTFFLRVVEPGAFLRLRSCTSKMNCRKKIRNLNGVS